MILAFSNDYTVTVLDDVQQANTCCEGIDVEEGVYTFTDERGFVFAARFTIPNRHFPLLSLFSSVASGVFTLELTSEQRPDLLAGLLAGRIAVCAGPTLSSTEALQAVLRVGMPSPTEVRA